MRYTRRGQTDKAIAGESQDNKRVGCEWSRPLHSMNGDTMFYFALDPEPIDLWRTDANGLTAAVYQRWVKGGWKDVAFPNPLSDDFNRGSWGYAEVTEAQADQLIARGNLLGG